MSWESLTRQFGAEEIGMLEGMPASVLAPSVIASGPLVGLRILAELLLHEDNERLEHLLADDGVRRTWLQFHEDPFVDDHDYLYAIKLRVLGMKYELA
jgi:hypothetical protein